MMDTMLFSSLPLCSDGNKHVLVVEDSLSSVILELHDKEKGNQLDAKYFISLNESHPLVTTILENENRIQVEKADLRIKFGINFSDFRTIAKH